MWCDKPKPRLHSPLTMCDIKASIVHATRNDRTHSGEGRRRRKAPSPSPKTVSCYETETMGTTRQNPHPELAMSYSPDENWVLVLICQHGVTSGKIFTPMRTSDVSYSYFCFRYHFWSTFYRIMSFMPFFYFFSEPSLAYHISNPGSPLCDTPASITATAVVRRCGIYCITKYGRLQCTNYGPCAGGVSTLPYVWIHSVGSTGPPPLPHFLFAQENLIQLQARFHSGQVECLGLQNLENLNLIVKYIKR